MSDVVIRGEGLSKRYRLGQYVGDGVYQYQALRDVIPRAFKVPFRLLKWPTRSTQEPASGYVWALKDVSFEVKQGESLGIIGRNGAGKTTLLKVLSRITGPTAGRARIRGRVGSLLEVGTGFHPELTGRENIYLSGTILGMARKDVERRFDEIVDFSGVERFIDTPVKRYSSGMWVRLGFAVAAHLEPEILLVDEVLAVGDVAFQKKCLGKMGDVAREGRTVLFVSHNMGAVGSLCGRVMLLEQGRVVMEGDPSNVISAYLSLGMTEEPKGEIVWPDDERAPGGDEMRLCAIRLIGPGGAVRSTFDVEKPIQVEICYQIKRPLRGMRINLSLLTVQGEIAFVTTDHGSREEELQPGRYKSTCTIPGRLLNLGKYMVNVGGGIPGVKSLLTPKEYLSFSTTGIGNHGSNYTERWPGVVCPKLNWRVEKVLQPEDRAEARLAYGTQERYPG